MALSSQKLPEEIRDAMLRRYPRLFKESTESDVTAARVAGMVEGEFWKAVPSGAVSEIVAHIRSVQTALALVAWIEPLKARLAYLAWLRKQLATGMRAATHLPSKLAELPAEVRAIEVYQAVSDAAPALQRALREEAKSLDELGPLELFQRAESKGIVVVQSGTMETRAAKTRQLLLKQAAESASKKWGNGLLASEIEALATRTIAPREVVARVAMRNAGLAGTTKSFLRTWIEPKWPPRASKKTRQTTARR